VKQDNRQFNVLNKMVQHSIKTEGWREPVHTRFLQAPLRKSWNTRFRWSCNILAWM
jgi:hypothetical protein